MLLGNGVTVNVAVALLKVSAEGAKAHAESQAQIAQLQLRSNTVPNAIETGNTEELRRIPITPAAIPPVTPPVADPPKVT